MILSDESKQVRVVNRRVTRAESLSRTPGNLKGEVKTPEWTTGHKELLQLYIQSIHGPAALPQTLLLERHMDILKLLPLKWMKK